MSPDHQHLPRTLEWSDTSSTVSEMISVEEGNSIRVITEIEWMCDEDTLTIHSGSKSYVKLEYNRLGHSAQGRGASKLCRK